MSLRTNSGNDTIESIDIDTLSIKKGDKIKTADIHKFRYSLAKIILLGFFSIFVLSIIASTIGHCKFNEYTSLLEKLIPILALIIGFYFGKERG